MITTPAGTAPSAYRALGQLVHEAGLLERRNGISAARIIFTVSAYLGGWAALFFIRDSWWIALAIAVYLAVMSTQVLFLGHDAGHQQVFTSHRANRAIGLMAGNLLTGLSYGWWIPKHNAHHAHPNEPGLDPDIGPGFNPPVIPTPEMTTARRRLLATKRKMLLVPIVALEFGMHLTSARDLAKHRGSSAVVEWLLLATNAGAYLAVVFLALSPVRALAFIALQQGIFGVYLRASFAPNHKGMVILEAPGSMSYLERQVITARNVTSGRVLNFLLGGLNYQIEHHLFPKMPRCHLAAAQPIVREFCRAEGIDYCEERLIDSYKTVLRTIRGAGKLPSDTSFDECTDAAAPARLSVVTE